METSFLDFIESHTIGFIRRRNRRYGYCCSSQFADIVQNVCVELLTEVGGNELLNAITTGEFDWLDDQLLRLAINRAIGKEHWRDEKRRSRGLPQLVSSDYQDNEPTYIDQGRMSLEIEDIVASFSEQQQTILKMKQQGYLESEIVHRLGCSRATYHRALHDVKKKLKRCLCLYAD